VNEQAKSGGSILRKAAIIGFFVFLGCIASAQRITIGIDAGVFLPSDSTVRNVFGDTWARIGLTPISFQTDQRWRFTFDVGFLNASSFGNDVTLIPITFGVTRAFPDKSEIVPYVALRAGPCFADVNSPFLGIDKSEVVMDVNASVGITVSKTFYFEIRYDWMSEISSLDFSGLFISAGIRLFDVRI